LHRQAATWEILRVISQSPSDAHPSCEFIQQEVLYDEYERQPLRVGGPPCIANAVMDALSEFGITPTADAAERLEGRSGRRGRGREPAVVLNVRASSIPKLSQFN
jgi:hypothetical protein